MKKPWKLKPATTLLLLLSLFTIYLLFRFSQDKIILITTTTTSGSYHHRSSVDDTCLGRYIYIHNLPSRFNTDILQDCKSITRPKDKVSMCKYLENSGFGPVIGGFNDSQNWYATNQFMLEVIFHEKMKRYKCLTRNSSLASAIYVPYYAGLDFRRNLRRRNVAARDAAGKELVKWLKNQPQWKGVYGFGNFCIHDMAEKGFVQTEIKV